MKTHIAFLRYILMIGLLSSCMSATKPLVDTTNLITPTTNIGITDAWDKDVDYAKKAIMQQFDVEDLNLVDVLGTYSKNSNISAIYFTFVDKDNQTYNASIIYTNNKKSIENINNKTEKISNFDKRTNLLSLIRINPIDVVDKLYHSNDLSKECFDQPVLFNVEVPDDKSTYPQVPYWTLAFSHCQSSRLFIDINAQNGDILEKVNR